MGVEYPRVEHIRNRTRHRWRQRSYNYSERTTISRRKFLNIQRVLRNKFLRWSIKKLLWKVLQNSHKNTSESPFFNKVTVLQRATGLKKRLWNKCIPVIFAKYFSTPLLQNTSRRLLLKSIENFLKVRLSTYKKISFYFLQWKPFKNNEKCFLFYLRSQDIWIFVLTFCSCRRNDLIGKKRLISNFLTSQPG